MFGEGVADGWRFRSRMPPQEESQDARDSLERALLQLSKSKEHEERLKQELDKQSLDCELLRDRHDKVLPERKRGNVSEKESWEINSQNASTM